jgi:signal transduction histidine kinase
VKEKTIYFISMAFFLFLSLIIFNPLLNNFFPPNSKFYLLTVYLSGWILALVMSVLLVTRSRAIIKANKMVREELGVLNKKYGYCLLEGEEKERKRVAEELHDGIGISLSTLKIKMSILLSETEDLTLIRFLGSNIKAVDLQCEKVRELSHQLSEKSLERYGLKISIEDFIETVNKSKKREVSFMQNLKIGELTPTSEVAIFKIVKGLLEPIWELDFKKVDLKIIIFYSTEKAMIKLNIEGEGFTLNLPSFVDFKNIITLLHGEIQEYAPNAVSKLINIEIPILLKNKQG